MSDRIMERSAIALERFVTRINNSVFVDGVAEATVPWSYSPLPFAPAHPLPRELAPLVRAINAALGRR